MQLYTKEAADQEMNRCLVQDPCCDRGLLKNYNSDQGGMDGSNSTVLLLDFSSKIIIAN